MNIAATMAVITLLGELIKVSPQVAAELKALFAKGDPTPADFSALRARVLAMKLEEN